MWYLMNSWKLLSENAQATLKKSTPPLNSKIASPPLFANIENFTGPSCRKEGAGVETVLSW